MGRLRGNESKGRVLTNAVWAKRFPKLVACSAPNGSFRPENACGRTVEASGTRKGVVRKKWRNNSVSRTRFLNTWTLVCCSVKQVSDGIRRTLKGDSQLLGMANQTFRDRRFHQLLAVTLAFHLHRRSSPAGSK